MAGGALESGGEAEGLGAASGLFGRGDGAEDDFAGFAVAGFDGVDEAGADVVGEREAVGEDEDGAWRFRRARGGGEVEFEEGLGGGELDDVAGALGSTASACQRRL